MEGEVLVFGSIDYLEIWNREVFESKLADDPFSDEDFAALADGGI
jgi:DNA-binding transcriptional regulator/RsmH inhibitor MraZ